MAVLKVKDGVQPKIIPMMAAISRVVAKLEEPLEVVITSAWDGVHSADSLHYALRALDIRTKNFASLEKKKHLVELLKAELGAGYQLIIESVGLPNEHLHVEFDP